MKATARNLLVVAVMGAFCETACGDGKFFAREKVPAKLPYQRALLVFHEGTETLVLQSKYELPQSAGVDSLGWVVPVPAVPELDSIGANVARDIFWNLAFHTPPDLHNISIYFRPFATVLFLGGIALLLLSLGRRPFPGKMKSSKSLGRWQMRIAAIITIGGFFPLGASMPTLGVRGVEVVKAEKVGIYEAKVIEGDSAEAITAWLEENGSGFSGQDEEVFESYVNRGWCFVTARVQADPNTPEQKVVAEGMVAPLILRFEAKSPVYPLALTSLVGTNTEILLYTLSDSKLACDERLPLRHAIEAEPGKVLQLPLAHVCQFMDNF